MTSGLLAGVLLAAASSLLLMSSGRLRRSARAPADDAGRSGISDAPLILDLLAAVLSSGASVEGALMLVADSCELPIGASLARVHGARLLGASWEASWEVGMAPVPRGTDSIFSRRLFDRRPGRDFRTLQKSSMACGSQFRPALPPRLSCTRTRPSCDGGTTGKSTGKRRRWECNSSCRWACAPYPPSSAWA